MNVPSLSDHHVSDAPDSQRVGRAFAADVLPGHVQMHWPEANPLIARGVTRRIEPDRDSLRAEAA